MSVFEHTAHSISRNVSEENLYSVLENYLIWAFREIANDGIFAKCLGGIRKLLDIQLWKG